MSDDQDRGACGGGGGGGGGGGTRRRGGGGGGGGGATAGWIGFPVFGGCVDAAPSDAGDAR